MFYYLNIMANIDNKPCKMHCIYIYCIILPIKIEYALKQYLHYYEVYIYIMNNIRS